MKYQNFAIIFVLILLPISIVLSYYIQTQTDTLVLQTTYQTKLNDSTYDAIAAYQMNSMNTQRVSGESVKSYVLASVNTFFTTLATNLGMSSASKQMILPYVPAILFTTYDGYYIYSPTYTSKVAINPDDGVAFTTNKKEILYMKKGQKIDENDLEGDKANGRTLKASSAEAKCTTNPNDSNVQYETNYMLKPFIYYSSQYDLGANSNFVASYSLDNYVTLYGSKSNGTKDVEPANANVASEVGGKAVTDEFTKSGYLIDPSKVTIQGQFLVKEVQRSQNGNSKAEPTTNGVYSYDAVIDANKNPYNAQTNAQHDNERFEIVNVNTTTQRRGLLFYKLL